MECLGWERAARGQWVVYVMGEGSRLVSRRCTPMGWNALPRRVQWPDWLSCSAMAHKLFPLACSKVASWAAWRL
jgi:hypothetical protein